MPHPNKAPDIEALVAMVDSIRIFSEDNGDLLSDSENKLVENMPSKNYILYKMNDAERDVLYRSVRHIWQKITGKDPEFESTNQDAVNLDGVYWMLPGGVIISGFNHFQTAKENKLLICSLLNINTMVFEKLLASGNPNEIISLILARGGVRTLINREKSEVVMQTNESSWPWVKQKLEKMYHKNKTAKVVDLSRPYQGWQSGVTIKIK
jgi:hypothetical protein